MSLPVVRRYARTLNRPLSEVEDIWRDSKKAISETGNKNDFPLILVEFRKRLGLHPTEGQIVYYEGARSEIVSETPAFALVRILEIGKVSENLQPVLKSSNGLIVLNYTSLCDSKGVPLAETTDSIGVGSGTVRPMGKEHKFTFYSLEDLQKWSKEGSNYLHKIWKSMSEQLTEEQKLWGFTEILRFEGRLEHISPGLVEDLAKKYTIGVAQDKPKVAIEESDWNVILHKEEVSPEVDDRDPLPDAPEVPNEPAKEPEKKAAAAPVAPLTGDRTASDPEIDALVSRIKGERKTVKVPNADELKRLEEGIRPGAGVTLEEKHKKRDRAWGAVID